MNLAIITNLYPRPDQPRRGLFNAQLFEAMAAEWERSRRTEDRGQKSEDRGQRTEGSASAIGTAKAEDQRSAALAEAMEDRDVSVEGRRSDVESETVPSRLPRSTSHMPQSPISTSHSPSSTLTIICLVPEWRIWRWGWIREWNTDQKSEISGQRLGLCRAMPGSDSEAGSMVYGLRRALRSADREADRDEAGSMVQGPGSSSLRVHYLPVFYIPLIGRSLSWLTYYLSFSRIKGRTSECDAVLATWLYPDVVAAGVLAKQLNKPLWIKVHGSDAFHLKSSSRRRLILDACSYARGIIANCRYLADRLAEAGAERSKLHVVPNGVDENLFKFRSRQEALKELLALRSTDRGEEWSEVRSQKSEVSVEGRTLKVESEKASCNVLQSSLSHVPRSTFHLPQSFLSDRIVLFIGNLVHVKGPDIMLEAWGKVAGGGGLEVEGGRWKRGEHSTLNTQHPTFNVQDQRDENLEPITNAPSIPIACSRESASSCSVSNGVHLRSSAAPCRLLIIGDGPMRKNLEKQAQRLGIADSVVFLGNRPHEEVALWMNVADCLCLASRSEGMPNVVLEALASGLPVVATNVGEVPFMIRNGENGFIAGRETYTAGQAHLIAVAIERVLARQWNREEIASSSGANGWAKAAGDIINLIEG